MNIFHKHSGKGRKLKNTNVIGNFHVCIVFIIILLYLIHGHLSDCTKTFKSKVTQLSKIAHCLGSIALLPLFIV